MKARTCRPIEPLRCWQFQPSADLVPMWVARHLSIVGSEEKPGFQLTTDRDGEWILDPDDWVVETPDGGLAVYTAVEFPQAFELTPVPG